MGQEPRTSRSAVAESKDPEQIRAQIDETRQELGDTVEALAAKTDVKGQARRKVEQTKSSISEKRDELVGRAAEASPDGAADAASQAAQKAREHPLPVSAAGAFLAGLMIGRLTKRRKKEVVLWPR